MKILLLLLSFTVSAENWVHLGMWSHHQEEGLNETHNLVGIEIDGYFIHKFENSMKDTAYYAGVMKRDGYCIDKLCLGYSYGLIKGYSFKEVSPIAFGVISYEYEGIGADIEILPGEVYALRLRFSDKAFQYLDFNAPWETKGYMELSWDHFDPDGKGAWGFERNNGAAYDVKLYTSKDWFIKLGYTTTNFGTHPEQGLLKYSQAWRTGNQSQVSSRGFIQIGKDFDYFSLGLSTNQVSIQENYYDHTTEGLGKFTSVDNKHHRGFGAHISTDYQLSENWSIYTEAAIINDLITDIRLTLETRYKIIDELELTLRWIDWERWNMSQAQLGLRYNFQTN